MLQVRVLCQQHLWLLFLFTLNIDQFGSNRDLQFAGILLDPPSGFDGLVESAALIRE